MAPTNVFTVDVEDWYHANALSIPSSKWDECSDHVIGNTRVILDLLKQNRVRGVFFVLGDVAKRHPELIHQIATAGHEIGSHSFRHQLLGGMSRLEFQWDFQEARRIITDITGSPVKYYRAPSWSINRQNLWVLDYLADEGIVCDSSLQPFVTPLSGIGGIPDTPFYPVIGGRKLPLLEFPPSVGKITGLTIPFSGGFYFRFWPYPFTRTILNHLNRSRECLFYIHPWEIDSAFPRLKTEWAVRFVQYYHLAKTLPKLNRLLRDFSFIPLEEAIRQREYPDFELD